MDSLVSTTWLVGKLGIPDLIVLDCTVFLRTGDDGRYISDSGRPNFEAGHIPGAAFADLNEDLVDATSPHRYALGEPQDFATAMEALGVHSGARVVLYDDNGSMWAARVWWMLRWIGFDAASILDGGLKAWRDEGRELEVGPSLPEAAALGSLSVTARPEVIADKAEVMAAVADGGTCLIDALPSSVFNGERQPYARPGHIPGAINVSSNSMIDFDTGRFKSMEEISELLPSKTDDRTVVY